jgi:hypothetical protein
MSRHHLLVAALGLAGCAEVVDSGNVATEGMYAEFAVGADGSGETVVASTLRVGGDDSNTFVELSSSDSLIAFQDGESEALTEFNGALGSVHYSATFTHVGNDDEDAHYRVAFLRTQVEGAECQGVSAPDSSVTLAAPFTLTAPTAAASHSRTGAGAFDVEWSNTELDDLEIWVSGDCIITRLFMPLTDAGIYTIDEDEIESLPGSEGSTCDITLSVERVRDGDLDSNFGEGGYVVSRQYREVTFSSTP